MRNAFRCAAQALLQAARAPHVEAVLLFGPTAVGKTALLETLHDQPIELVSADSRQVYRGFEISTAYPSVHMRARIPHHLIDMLHFAQPYTVATFVKAARNCIAEIRSRGKIPIVSGGTAYYLYHLCCGLPQTPPSHAALRADLLAQADTQGLANLYARLYALDPEYAQSIAATDKLRIVRALEIIETTGKKLAEFKPNKHMTNKAYVALGLMRERQALNERIAQRIDAMYARGLTSEVYALYQQGLRLSHNAARTIGVQEFLQNCEVTKLWDAGTSELPHTLWQETLRPRILCNTRHYAKRQTTFFKRFQTVQWITLT